MKAILAALAIIALSGCAQSQHDRDFGPLPANYKALVKEAILARLKDPDSAKFDFYKQPSNVDVNGFKGRWTVCVRVNAKTSDGGFTGKKPWAVFIEHGRVPTGYGVRSGRVALATCSKLWGA